MAEDFYKTLGVDKKASEDEIKRAYRKLALKNHPDKGGDSAEFQKVNEAYQILSDPQKRTQYDQFGSAGFSGAGAQGGQGGFGPNGAPFGGGHQSGGFDFEGEGFEFNFGGEGLGDIFGDFFSSAFATIQAEVQISPSQAVLGDQIDLEVAGEKVSFDINPGTQDGTQYRLRGKGRAMKNGHRGDLILIIRVRLPERLSKEQKELWEKLKDLDKEKRSWWNR